MKRIMLVDAHDIARRGMRDMLATRPRLEVIAEARSAAEALDEAQKASPDLVIIEHSLPDLNGTHLTAQLRRMLPSVEILICSAHHSEQMIVALVEAGARGFVGKAEPEDRFLKAVDALCVHRPYFSDSLTEILLRSKRRKPDARATGITSREGEVVRLIADGKLNKQIAYLLGVSIKTVETHRAAAMTKLNLHNTAELVRYACRNEMVAA